MLHFMEFQTAKTDANAQLNMDGTVYKFYNATKASSNFAMLSSECLLSDAQSVMLLGALLI